MGKDILELLMNYHTTLDNGNNVIEMEDFDKLTDDLYALFAKHIVNRSLPTDNEIISEYLNNIKKIELDTNTDICIDLELEAYKLGFKQAQEPSDNG